MSLRLCALQIPHVEIANIQEKAAQLDFIEREIRSRPNNDVFVLPELSVTGYSTTCFEKFVEAYFSIRKGENREILMIIFIVIKK